MKNVNKKLKSLIDINKVIIINCNDQEYLLNSYKNSHILVTKEMSDFIFQLINRFTYKNINNTIIIDCIKTIICVFTNIVEKSTEIIDCYTVSKILNKLMEKIITEHIFIYLKSSVHLINTLIAELESLTESVISKIKILSSNVETGKSGYFVSKLTYDIKNVLNRNLSEKFND